MRRRTRNDILLFVVAVLIGLAAMAGTNIFYSSGDTVSVTVDGTLYGTFPLNEPRIIELETNTVVIEDGKVYMEYADCPDKLCVYHRAISRAGETIICLPNRIAVKIEGKNGADAVSR